MEKEQTVNLMNIIADEIYIGKFDTDSGTYQIEKQLQKGENIWLGVTKKIINRYFLEGRRTHLGIRKN